MKLRPSSAANSDISDSGTPRPDLAKGWRMISLRPFAHLLFYATEAADIVVMRVIDGRRDLKAALRDI